MKKKYKIISEKLFTTLKNQGYFETAEYYYAKFKKQGLTDEEIAESYVLPMKLTPLQKEKDKKFWKEFKKIREEHWKNLSEEQKNHFIALGEKFRQEDLKQNFVAGNQ